MVHFLREEEKVNMMRKKATKSKTSPASRFKAAHRSRGRYAAINQVVDDADTQWDNVPKKRRHGSGGSEASSSSANPPPFYGSAVKNEYSHYNLGGGVHVLTDHNLDFDHLLHPAQELTCYTLNEGGLIVARDHHLGTGQQFPTVIRATGPLAWYERGLGFVKQCKVMKVSALVYTGADVSIMSYGAARHNGLPIIPLLNETNITQADGTAIKWAGYVEGGLYLAGDIYAQVPRRSSK
jgi:hypothetical protein